MGKLYKALIFFLLFPALCFAAEPKANRVRTSTTNFAGLLSSSDSTVQAALDTLDDSVSDIAYDATSWDSVTTISPSKNSLRDKFEALIGLHSGPTYTVASSTATWAAFYDYQCDGTDDDVQIQAAIDALPAAGGIIQLSEGSFSITTVEFPFKNNITIQGAGGDATQVTMKAGSTANMFQANVNQALLTIIFRDFTINGNKANAPSGGYGYYDSIGSDEPDDTVFERVFFLQMPSDAIRIEKSYNLILDTVIVETTVGKCVNIIDGEDGFIKKCKFINSNSEDVLHIGADNMVISDNRIIPNPGFIGINVAGARTIVANNMIIADGLSGTSTGINVDSTASVTELSNNIIGGSVGNLTTGINIEAGAVNTFGEGNLVVLGAGSTNFVDAGTTTRVQVNQTWNASSGGIYAFNGILDIGDGGTTNYARMDADGDLTFNGTADFLVAGNKYAFRYSVDEDAGLFFNSTSSRYEWRDTLAADIWHVGLTGATVQIGSATATNFISNVATGTQPYATTSTTLNTNLNADKVDGIDGFGYSLQASTVGSLATVNDSTTYYFGAPYNVGLTTTAAALPLYIPKTGTIKAVYIHFLNAGTLGTNETSTINVRLNNTTDTVVSTGVTNDATSTAVNNTALSIAVAAGDYIEFKWVTPVWVTNPTTVRASAVVYIE